MIPLGSYGSILYCTWGCLSQINFATRAYSLQNKQTSKKQAKDSKKKKKEEKEKKGMALCSAFPFVFHSLDYSPTWRDLQYCRRIQKCLFAGMKAEKQKMFRSNVHLHIPHSYNITLTVYIYIYTQKKRECTRERAQMGFLSLSSVWIYDQNTMFPVH